MIVSKKKKFYSEATTKKTAAEDLANQILLEIFGVSFTGRDSSDYPFASLSENAYIELTSTYYLYLRVNSSIVSSTQLNIYTDSQTKKYYISCLWVESEYLKKFGSIWIWKGRYIKNSSDNLYDLAANTAYSSTLKNIEVPGMVAIAPLYSTDGPVIQDAYMYSCGNNIIYGKYYYIGGRLFFAMNSKTLLAVES